MRAGSKTGGSAGMDGARRRRGSHAQARLGHLNRPAQLAEKAIISPVNRKQRGFVGSAPVLGPRGWFFFAGRRIAFLRWIDCMIVRITRGCTVPLFI